MKNYIQLLLIVVCFFCVQKSEAREPTDLFVSKERGHSVGGCTKSFPCREISRAMSFVIPGDTIYIEDGNYFEFKISGFHATQERPLTLKAVGEKVRVIPNLNKKNSRDNIYIINSDWIIIDGITSLSAKRSGIRIDNSHYVTIKNSIFAKNGVWGIFANHSNDILIENNIAYGSKEQHGIYFSNSADRPIIRGNKVFNNNMCGIHLNGDLSMGEGRNVKADGIIRGAFIENNILMNNGKAGGAAINMDGVQNSIVRNNLLYDNHATGIALFVADGGAGPKDIKVYNNTIDMASDARWAIIVNKSIGSITIMNNILYNRNQARGALCLGNTSSMPNFLKYFGIIGGNSDEHNVYCDYNIYGGGEGMVTLNDNETRFGLKDWKKTKQDKNSFQSDLNKLFINADKGNYQLRPGSPAIDRGILMSNSEVDLKGLKRPIGKNIDIGAYEYSLSP